MTQQIQLRRDTSANWASVNPILAQGEIGLDLTTNQYKIGNGTSAWDSLPYGVLSGSIGGLDLIGTTSIPAVPSDGNAKLFALDTAGRTALSFLSDDGLLRGVQADLGRANLAILSAQPGGTTFTALGIVVPTAVGTATPVTPAVTNLYTRIPKIEYLVTAASTSAIAGFRSLTNFVSVGGTGTGIGGFHYIGTWGPATGVATSTNRAFFGLSNINSTPTDVEPSTVLNSVFMGWDAADTNIQMMRNDGSGTATKIDLGASFPVPTADRSSMYSLELYSPPGSTQIVYYRVDNLVTGATTSGNFNTKLPSTTTLLSPRAWMSVGGTSSVIGIGVTSIYLDTLIVS